MGTPHCSAFAITSNNPEVNVFVLADLMEEKGINFMSSESVCYFVYHNRLEVGTCPEEPSFHHPSISYN